MSLVKNKKINFEIFRYLKNKTNEIEVMVSINDIRVCKSCGNVFSKKAGITNILECPHCKNTSFDYVKIDNDELIQE